MKRKKVVIIGAGGFGREVLWLIRDSNSSTDAGNEKGVPHFDILGFVDDNPSIHNKIICDVPVLGSKEWFFENRDVFAVCSIGNPRIRMKVVEFLEKNGIKFQTVIHPSIKMSKYIEIGQGVVICAGNIITTQVKIKDHVHMNLNVTVGHDTIIGSYTTIYPGVNISGDVSIGNAVELGTNSSIIQGVSIGCGTILGAGAVVNKNIGDNVVAVGIPARTIKEIPEKIT